MKDVRGFNAVRMLREIYKNDNSISTAAENCPDNDPHVKAMLHTKARAGATQADSLRVSAAPVLREIGQYIFEQSIAGKLYAASLQLPYGTNVLPLKAEGAEWYEHGHQINCVAGNVASEDKLMPKQLGSIIVVTDELLKNGVAGSEAALRSLITSSVVRKLDETFCGAAAATVKQPAGLCLGLKPTGAAGVGDALDRHIKAGNRYASTFYIVDTAALFSITDAERAALATAGVQVIASEYVTKPFFVDAARLSTNFTGVDLMLATEASVNLDPASGQNVINGNGAPSHISLYQTNSAAIRAIMYANWHAAAGAVTSAQ